MKANKNKNLQTTIERYDESPLKPVLNKKGLLALTLILWGWAIHSSDSVIGASIAQATGINTLLWGTFVGGLLIVLNVFLGGFIGYKTGYPVNVTSNLVFGKKGSIIPNLLTIITLTGWAGYSIGLTAEFFTRALNVPEANHFLVISLFSIAFGAFVGLSTSIFGTKIIEVVSLISSPAMILLLLYLAYRNVASAGGWDSLLNIETSAQGWEAGGNANPFWWVVGLTFTSWISIGLYSSDYFRFAKKWQHVLFAGAFAYIFGKVAIQILGLVSARSMNTTNIFDIFTIMGALVLGFVIYFFDNWTSIDTQVYSSGLSVTNIFKLKRFTATMIITGFAIILAAAGIYNALLSYLVFIGTFVGPILGPVYGDYYLSSKWIIKKDYTKPFDTKIQSFRWSAIISWLLGVGFAYYYNDYGLIGLNGIIVSFVSYILLELLQAKLAARK